MSKRSTMALNALAITITVFSFILFTKITKDILFKGMSICSSSSGELLLGSVTLTVAAIISGFMGSLLVMRNNNMPHLAISGIILLHLVVTSISCDFWTFPFFLDTGIHLSMLFGVWLGDHGAKKFPLAPA